MPNIILGNPTLGNDEWLEKAYLEIVNPIVEEIISMTFEEKMERIYEFLVERCSIKENYDPNEKLQYPHIIRNALGKHPTTTTTKYCPVVYCVGVCKGFDLAYIDIASRVGIHLEEIIGTHYNSGHGWIGSLDNNGNIRHTDVYEGIKYKEQGLDIMQAYMRTTNELIQTGRYSEFYKSMEQARIKMLKRFKIKSSSTVERYEEVQTGFKVKR